MTDETKAVVRDAVYSLIRTAASPGKIAIGLALHESKVHFIPAKYRVLGGVLQSLNIRFGNFIEQLVALVVESDDNVQSLPQSRTKVFLSMTADTDALIDHYITKRQLAGSPDDCGPEFADLTLEIIDLESDRAKPKQRIMKDVDALFEDAEGTVVYLEIKYNDDHDTGKFVDINRKFLKTYAGLINEVQLTERNTLKPILYYFNPTKRWGPIYVPTSHILRGSQLFDRYFQIAYEDVDVYLRQLGDDPEVMAMFDDLYLRIRGNVSA